MRIGGLFWQLYQTVLFPFMISLFSPMRDFPNMTNVYGVIEIIDAMILSTWQLN